jgi:heme/copper-type cytochrome/quinol oxidase subunit 2
MGSARIAKLELLAAARALLRQDDRDRIETLRHVRHNRLLAVMLLACLMVLGTTALIIVHYRASAAAAQPSAKTAGQGAH